MNEYNNEIFTSIIKKNTPILKKHITLKQNTKPIYTLDQIIEMMNLKKNISINPIQNTLNIIMEEPEPKIDYHLQILHFIHYYDFSNTHFDISWPLNDQCILNFIRHTNINVKDKWYYKSNNNYIIVNDIQQFINENIINFEEYLENDRIIKDIINQLQPILGEYNLTFIDIKWDLSIGTINTEDYNVFLNIVIDRFNTKKISVTFDNKTIVYNNITLIEFINKNIDQIKIFKQEINKYNSNKQILNNEKIQQEENKLKIEIGLRNLHLDEKLKQYNDIIKQKKILVFL